MLRLLVIVTLFNVLNLKTAEAGGTVTLNLKKFNNPKGQGANGHCCDGKWKACPGKCDHYFEICITNRTNSEIETYKRHAAAVESSLMKLYGKLNPNSEDVDAGCVENGYTRSKTMVDKNHIEFTGSDAVRVTLKQPDYLDSDYTVQIRVFDEDDVGKDDYVDTLTGNVHLPTSGTNKTFAFKSRTEISGVISYACDDDYYDCPLCGATGTPRCSVYCKSYRPQGHHGNCNSEGAFICEEGWTGENCDQEKTTTTTTTTTPATTTTTTTEATTSTQATTAAEADPSTEKK